AAHGAGARSGSSRSLQIYVEINPTIRPSPSLRTTFRADAPSLRATARYASPSPVYRLAHSIPGITAPLKAHPGSISLRVAHTTLSIMTGSQRNASGTDRAALAYVPTTCPHCLPRHCRASSRGISIESSPVSSNVRGFAYPYEQYAEHHATR